MLMLHFVAPCGDTAVL